MMITTKIIFEKEKVYLSIEGNPGFASKDELNLLRDRLVEAFSVVLGLASPPAENLGLEGLERVSVPPEVEAVVEQPKAENVVSPAFEVAAPKKDKPVKKNVVLPKLGFGKYKDLTAKEVLAKSGGRGYLEYILPIVAKNAERYPENQAKLDSIKQVLAEAK